MAAVDHVSPLSDPSRHRIARDISVGSIHEVTDRAASPSVALWDPSLQTRHPADNGPVERAESPVENLLSATASPLPTFEESQRREQRETEDDGSYTSVASGPLATLSLEATASRVQLVENSSPSTTAGKRSFFSSLLMPRPSPNLSPQVQRITSPSQSGLPRSVTQPDGLGLGLGILGDGAAASRSPPTISSSVPISKSSPADLGTQDRKPATAAELAAMGLVMSTLTVPLTTNKTSPPTCGVVLDSKYLLIGHAMGLDFLPLDPAYRDSIKRPVPLIKKTRFRQLAILEERSNVLLAIAGRNHHVRVYALDGVRTTIQRRIREILPGVGQSAPAPVSKAERRLSAPPRPATERGQIIKGKGRAEPPAPLQNLKQRRPSLKNVPASPPPPYRKLSLVRGLPPSPSRSGSVVAALPTQSSASLRTSSSRDTIIHARRPSTISLGKRRASFGSNNQLYATAISRQGSQSATEEEEWTDSSRRERSTRPFVAARMEARSASFSPSSMDAEFRAFLDQGPPALQVEPPTARWPPPADFGTSALTAGVPDRLTKGLPRSGASPQVSDTSSKSPIINRMQREGSQNSFRSVVSSFSQKRVPLTPRSPVSDAGSEGVRALRDFLNEAVADDQVSPVIKQRVTRSPGMPRSASRGPGEGSMGALAAFLQESAPSSPAQSPALSHRPRTAPMIARSASVDVRNDRESSRDLAAMLNAGPPEAEAEERPRSASRASSASWRTETASPAPGHRDSIASASTIADEDNAEDATLLPRPRPEADDVPRPRKRWSMLDAVLRPPGALPSASSSAVREDDSGVNDAAVLAVVDSSLSSASPSSRPTAMTTQSPPLADSRKAPRARLESPEQTIGPTLEGSNPAMPNYSKAELHPASATAPLEYVKLARTKGARLLKAVETRKRTYLAVLCGDGSERIELFTGSRNVSLSLNRTFVLPESPRSVEFQLQGDDLVDIYLVYDESIFALEPATVRVREVGIARNERRAARRERDRTARGGDSAAEPARAARDVSPHRTDPSPQRSTAARQDVVAVAPPNQTLADIATSAADDGLLESIVEAANPVSTKPRPAPGQCFTAWQQLPFIPPVPPSVLASSFVIPPTYEAVLATTPQPKQEGFDGAEPEPVPQPVAPSFVNDDAMEAPLLSPISLLANHPSRHSGPPGLFFVCRGRHMTNIVDGDGRSVIRRPIKWDLSHVLEKERAFSHLDVFARLEMVVVEGGLKTVLVALGPTQVQAIEVGPRPGAVHTGGEAPPAESVEVASAEVATRRSRSVFGGVPDLRDVTFLGKAGECVIWSERTGSTFCIHALSASR